MGTGREELTDKHNDLALKASDFLRDNNVIRDILVVTTLRNRFIEPGDTEEIQRVDISDSDILQSVFNLLRDQRRIIEHSESRQEDVILFANFDG